MRVFNLKLVRDFVCFAAAALSCFAACAARADEPPAIVLLEFYADGCGPCQAMKPVVDALVREGFAVRCVNVGENRELAARFGVESVPCFILLERGREVDRVVGQTTVERLRRMFREQNPQPPLVPHPSPLAPHPAWRFAQPVGHRAAVVRVLCDDGGQAGNLAHAARTQSIGSGTLVRWGGKIVVLTARHVVKDARKIVVQLHDGRTHRARVLAVDAVWDCAVLELDREPTGIQPVEVERGRAAMQAAGNRLESCGYGPDGRLACNSGLFLGYKRSSAAPHGPDDWFTISGHARGGDSGGGVFNSSGRLVGVLWGTDGQEVVCVQAGRLHKLLDQAVVHEDAMQQKSILQRVPTPAAPGRLRVESGESRVEDREAKGEGEAERGEEVAGMQMAASASVLPWRKEIEEQERKAADALGRIDAKLDLIGRQPSAPACGQADPRVDAALQQAQEANTKLDVLLKLSDKSDKSDKSDGSDRRARLGQRIHEKAEEVKERVDGVLESPFARHVFFIACAAIVIWIAVSQHRKAGTKTLVERGADALATATAGTPLGPMTNMLDKAVDTLGQRLRDLDAKIETKVSGLQQQVTQTALATPVANQSPAAPSIAK
jgi:thiol-disulfide isomerase/thioredoxin